MLTISHFGNWVQVFDKLAQLGPKIVIPGHSHPTNLEQARKETRDYLVYLRTEVRKFIDKGEMQHDAENKIDQSRFKYLTNYELLAKHIAGQIYLEMEKEAF